MKQNVVLWVCTVLIIQGDPQKEATTELSITVLKPASEI